MDHSSHRKAKQGVSAGEALPYGIPDTFPAKVVVTDMDGQIAYASDKFLALLGAAGPDVIGQNLSRYLADPTDEASSTAVLSQTALSDTPMKLTGQDGHHRNVVATADNWRDPDGRLYRVIGCTDVTRFLQVEQELLMKSFRLESCLDGTNAGTWEWNVQTGETRFNERWAEIVGYSLQELEPVSIDTWTTLAHPDDLPTSARMLEKHFAGQQPFYDIETRMCHKDGHDVWVRDRGRVFTWTKDGKPEWMFGTHFLIDCEKRAEVAQRRDHSILEAMSRMSGVGGWEVDIAAKTVIWSSETRRIHGVDDNYMPSIEDSINFYAPEARPVISAAVEEGMKSGKPWDLELPFTRLNGERLWVRAVGEVIFEAGKPSRIVGAFQNIADKVRDRNELIAAKEWTTFAAAKGRVGLWSLDAVEGQLNWDEQMTLHFGYDIGNEPKTVAEWLKSLHEDSRAKLKQAIRKSMFSGDAMDLELNLSLNDGRHRVVKLVGAAHFDQEGTVDRLQGACFDLTDEREMVARLEEQATKLSVTLSSIGDGVITTDDAACITWMNPEAEKLTGWTTEDAQGMASQDVLKIYSHNTGKPVSCPIRRCLQERMPVVLQADTILRREDRTEIAIDDSAAPLLDGQQRVIGAVMVFRDTTKQRELSRDIEYRASHDQLTGLLNRSAFIERLEECLSDPLKQNGSYLLCVDLDHFKRVNDSLGHDAGDAVLTRIAKILRDCAGDGAIVARLGGDEFAILLRAKNAETVQSIGQAICHQAAEGTFLKRANDVTIPTGASIGIANLSGDAILAAEALRRADIAAYSAKTNGRGQVCVWNNTDASMQAMGRQTSLINLIENAILHESWIVHEQCICDIDDNTAPDTFAELLIRLPDGNGEMIGPSDFLPAAERYGLMVPIDLWMCKFALDRIADNLKDKGNKIYSVNISASSVGSQNFQQSLMELMSSVPEDVRNRVCFEVTETAILKNYEDTRVFLSALRALGARIAIDDFGAGATSFRYFQNLPADYLKIDGSSIQNMDNPVEAASIECFLRMAQVANLKTIAEHVESDDQIAILNGLNVDYVQGYALGYPH